MEIPLKNAAPGRLPRGRARDCGGLRPWLPRSRMQRSGANVAERPESWLDLSLLVRFTQGIFGNDPSHN